jgi:hypothetical protein
MTPPTTRRHGRLSFLRTSTRGRSTGKFSRLQLDSLDDGMIVATLHSIFSYNFWRPFASLGLRLGHEGDRLFLNGQATPDLA